MDICLSFKDPLTNNSYKLDTYRNIHVNTHFSYQVYRKQMYSNAYSHTKALDE